MSHWTPFWLSLAVPGSGQLLRRSWTAAPWMLLAAATAAVFASAASLAETNLLRFALALGQVASLFAVGLASGLHARCLTQNPAKKATANASSQVCCHRTRGRRVRLSIEVATSHAPEELWRIVSDLPRFLTIDPFHERVTLMRRTPAAGVHLVLDHSVCGIRLRRVGRILAWREGEGYAISDLSVRGKQVGFPHVFTFRIEPLATDAGASSRLRVEIRGRWTSPVIPAWLGRLWLVGVCRAHARMLRQSL